MQLDTFIKRPVVALVLSIFLIIIGLVSYQKLTVSQYPSVSKPIIDINIPYPGASASTVEELIVTLIEPELLGIEGVDTIWSDSSFGQASFHVHLKEQKYLDRSLDTIREKIYKMSSWLPKDAESPQISKSSSNDKTLMWLVFTSSVGDQIGMYEYVDQFLLKQFQMSEGVSKAFIVGMERPKVQIRLDIDKLAAYDLTVAEVTQAIEAENHSIPAGKLQRADRRFTVDIDNALTSVPQIRSIVIAKRNQAHITLAEVAEVVFQADEDVFLVHYDGQPAIGLGINKQGTANPIEVSNGIRALVTEMQSQLPGSITLDIAFDSARDIKSAISEVYTTIFEAIFLVLIIIFVFLKSARATFIPAVAIPISLIGTFALMQMAGISINLLTLLAMVLAIGLVVDDAIVVLENTTRHIELGLPPFKAAIKSINEIKFAVIAMTLTLAAVFMPILFAEGHIGVLFYEFAMVLAGTVIISGIVALTLTPMLCAYALKKEMHAFSALEKFESLTNWVSKKYLVLLNHLIRSPLKVLGILALIFLSNYLIWGTFQSEIAPQENESIILAIGVGPSGASMSYTKPYAKQITDILQSQEEMAHLFDVIGFPDTSQSFNVMILKDAHDRKRTQQEIAFSLYPPLSQITGMNAFAFAPPPSIVEGGNRGSNDMKIYIQSAQDYEVLLEQANDVILTLQNVPGLSNVEFESTTANIAYKINIDKKRLSELGISTYQLGSTLQTLFSGQQVGYYHEGSQAFSIWMQAPLSDRHTADQLSKVWLKTNTGQNIPLSEITTYELGSVPPHIWHRNQLRVKTINLKFDEALTLDEAKERIATALAPITGGDLIYDFDEVAEEIVKSNRMFIYLTCLAFIFIYLILSAQFNSFIDPWIILITAPMAFIGGLVLLKLVGGTINIYSQIGIVTLIGLISKHGIMLVEFANQKLEHGADKFQAILQSAQIRFRPIIMTTFATTLGAMPLLFAQGVGNVSRSHMGAIIVGGMVVGTFFTLVLVPSIYVLLKRTRRTSVNEKGLH